MLKNIQLLLAIINAIKPFLAELGPIKEQIFSLLKQIGEIIKGAKGNDAPLVGGPAVDQSAIDEGVATLTDAGMPEAEARELLAL